MKNKLASEILHSYILDDSSDSLSHHGIKNMHWGVKNGPPYPLDKKVSARIKKGKNEKVRYSKKELEDMRKNPNARKYRKMKVGLSHLFDIRERHISDVTNFFKDPQAEGTKYYSAKLMKDATANVANLISETGGKAYRTLDRPGHRATVSDALACNQQRTAGWSSGKDRDLRNNCGKCAATMYLRSLGYDVQAGRSERGVIPTALQYWFDGARQYKQKGAVNLYNQMLSFGNQGKGTLDVRHKTGGGHAVYFQNERGADGKIRPVIYDGQIGKRYNTVSDFLKAEHADMTRFSVVTRLDTATPNWKNLAEDSVCRLWKPNESRKYYYKITDPSTTKKYNDTDTGYSLFDVHPENRFETTFSDQMRFLGNIREQYGVKNSTGRR